MNKSYEELFNRLNEIVNLLQNQEINIDESIELFKEGVELQKQCQLILSDAEARVVNILDENNQEVPFSEL